MKKITSQMTPDHEDLQTFLAHFTESQLDHLWSGLALCAERRPDAQIFAMKRGKGFVRVLFIEPDENDAIRVYDEYVEI